MSLFSWPSPAWDYSQQLPGRARVRELMQFLTSFTALLYTLPVLLFSFLKTFIQAENRKVKNNRPFV